MKFKVHKELPMANKTILEMKTISFPFRDKNGTKGVIHLSGVTGIPDVDSIELNFKK